MARRSQNSKWILALVALGLGVGACAAPNGVPPTTPAWALGEQPNFSGTIPNWADGDAIAPSTGSIFGMAFVGGTEDLEVGFGSVAANGDFTFGLQLGSTLPSGSIPVETLCPGLGTVSLSVSNAAQMLIVVNQLEVPELFVEGQHARPLGGILIRESPPTADFLIDRFSFVHASADGTVTGTCTDEGITATIDLDLRQGWNSVFMALEGGIEFTTAAISAGAKWYLVNPVVLGHD